MPNIWPWTGTSANTNTKKDDDDPSNPWLCAGPVSSFPNIVPASGENEIELCPPPPSPEDGSTDRNPDEGSTSPARAPPPPPCRVFSQAGADTSSASPTCTPSSPSSSNHTPTTSTTTSTTHLLPTPLDAGTPSSLLLFQYRSQIYATPYLCPHQSYPLTHASVSDIEDFGVVLSAGITCPRHGWTWDLHTGEADRGRYRLPLWEVQVRDAGDGEGEGEGGRWFG